MRNNFQSEVFKVSKTRFQCSNRSREIQINSIVKQLSIALNPIRVQDTLRAPNGSVRVGLDFSLQYSGCIYVIAGQTLATLKLENEGCESAWIEADLKG